MNPDKLNFYIKYLPIAMELGKKYDIPPFAILVQAGIESNFGKKKIGNNLFGIKYNPRVNTLKKLVTTTEYGNTLKPNYPEVISVTPTGKNNPKYKYKVKDWFADYPSELDSFDAYVKLLVRNPRYKDALKEKDPLKFIQKVVKAGYATDSNYSKLAEALLNEIDTAVRRKILLLPSPTQTILGAVIMAVGIFFYSAPNSINLIT